MQSKQKYLPVIISRGVFVYPNNTIPMEVGRPISLNAVNIATNEYDDYVFVSSQIDPGVNEPNSDDVYLYGTICKIVSVTKRKEQNIQVLLEGIQRARVENYVDNENMFFAEIEPLDDVFGDAATEAALVRANASAIDDLTGIIPNFPKELVDQITQGVSASNLSDMIAQYFPFYIEKKQELMETLDVNKRLKLTLHEIRAEKTISEIEAEINQVVQERINENQKEFYLRERIRAMKDELGEGEDRESELEDILKELDENPYPKEVVKKVKEEIKKLEMMPPASSEANVVRTYIDWIMALPWYQKTEDTEDLTLVADSLNEDHYGLEKVKERIIEYLAVMKMTDSLKAPIICLVGPPGVGKTSIAKSIARAMNRKFVKASLGGVKDESEIRGHRRTYLGAMPGRIIQGMKKAETINPVFLLDEIDKMSSDYKGDPASAMLEVLDPEQNSFFSDHYLEESYDLSNVMFIATANYLENIPNELQDRLEIIQLSSYTEHEKVQIAKNYLLKKQAKAHGLKVSQLKISDNVLRFIIQRYTREAGVRQLERTLAKIARKQVVKIMKKEELAPLNKKEVEELLGKPIFSHTIKDNKNQVGIINGLAYTQYGGDILPIEVTSFKGKGRLVITGQLGDVMKESANIALGYVKANAKKYGINPKFFEENDIHIHVPEGAVPKDGPSAGISMASAIISALTNTKTDINVGMTGEITLRGNVLPIGGLKEKSISAHRSGLTKIIVPKENEKDLEDIPAEVKENLDIVLVNKLDDVLKEVLV